MNNLLVSRDRGLLALVLSYSFKSFTVAILEKRCGTAASVSRMIRYISGI